MDVAESFAAGYTALLPRRVERIVRTVGLRDREMAMDASLSLKTTSWLAGAMRMNQLCRQLELALAGWAAAVSMAQDIELHLPRLQDAMACPPRPAFAESSPLPFPAEPGVSPAGDSAALIRWRHE